MWNPTNEIHGRVYYTADALGKLDLITPAMFRAIHVDNKPMTDEKDIQKMFEEHGVPEVDFNRTFRSFSVESQLKRAKDLTVKYRVQGVPLLVVNGKYTTNGPKISSHQILLAVADELVQRERQRE
jgi:thiol:disulfide interchange protein DsbA